MLEHLSFLFAWSNFLMLVLGVVVGMVIGALPGLTATMAVAICTPLTFFFPPDRGLCLLLGIYNAAMFGGAISAILINTPGTPAAIATTFDGYPMTRQGRAGLALTLSAFGSAGGGLISFVFLAAVAKPLSEFALQFGPREFFALAMFGLMTMVSLASESLLKGLVTGFLGLLLATVGIDSIHGTLRFASGFTFLSGGISFIAVMIGLFGLSEIFMRVLDGPAAEGRYVVREESRMYPTWAEIKQCTPSFFISTLVGIIVGVIPGTGGDLASLLAWEQSKGVSKEPEKFGKGSIEGVVATETANNAVIGGDMTTMLTLGIPGDSVTAVLIGSLMMWGIQPGPLLYQKHPELIGRIILIMIVATFLSLALCLYRTKTVARWILKMPEHVLHPLVIVLCVVGTFSINHSLFDVAVMTLSGFFGVFLRRFGYPSGPIVLGLLLGPMTESNLRRGLVIGQGNPLYLFHSPIALFFWGMIALFLLRRFIRYRKRIPQAGNATGRA